MIKRVTLLVPFTTLLFAVTLSGHAPVTAHPASSRYDPHWNVNVLDWRFGDLQFLNTSAFKTGIRVGIAQWDNAYPSAPFDWDEDPQDTSIKFTKGTICEIDHPDDVWIVARTWDGPGNVYASTQKCGGTHFTHMVVAYDTQESSWYTGSLSPGSGQVDLRSIATHEAGHLTGSAGHWDEASGGDPFDSVYCNGVLQRHTMCRAIGLGQTHWRSLEEHDVHTWQNWTH